MKKLEYFILEKHISTYLTKSELTLVEKIQTDLNENHHKVDEAVTLLSISFSVLLSSPVILQLLGLLLATIGIKLGRSEKNVLAKIAHQLDHAGHTIHDKFLAAIMFTLKPLTGKLSPSWQQKIAQLVFIVIILSKILTSGGVASVDAILHNKLGVKYLTYDALNTIKVSEIGIYIKKRFISVLKRIMGKFSLAFHVDIT